MNMYVLNIVKLVKQNPFTIEWKLKLNTWSYLCINRQSTYKEVK